MEKAYKSRNFIIGFTFITFLLLSLIYSANFAKAQNNDETLEINSNFQILEFADNINTSNSISSIDIPLPSTSWNITNIEMNFTGIKLGQETVTIEEGGASYKKLNKGDRGYGVQLNISEPTLIFGVHIHGYLDGNPVSDVNVEIKGYNSGLPNNTKYGDSVPINMSIVPSWYVQYFPNPIPLNPGYYFLVINGSDYENNPSDNSDYHLHLNEEDSIHTNLYTVVYDGIWSNLDIGNPFRHKLIQRVDRSFNPEEINMILDIDGSLFPITGNGSITVNKNISPNSDVFNIPVYNNRSIELLFNLSFHIKLQNFLNTEAFISIQENLANLWTLNPEISRYYSNYSVKFIYPNSWYNLTIYRDIGFGWENITADIIKDPINHFIFLPDNTIIEGSDWRITANSPNIQLPLNVQKTKFSGGQEIQFSVLPPIPPGNITFRLINPLGYQAQPDIIYVIETIETEERILNYTLPSNPHEGFYKAYVFWNNATDAGVITQEFEISIPFVLDPMLIVIIVSAIAALSIASFTTYKLVKHSKRKHEAYRQSIFNKYMDVLNLDYFIITHKKSGLNLYEQILAGKSIDASLIAGFLEAIRSFGIELTGAGEQSQTIKLEYQDSKILMSEFKSFRILLIMKENPSQDFLESIKALSYDIDKSYGKMIESFNGNLIPFKGVGELLEQHLQTALIFPLEIIKLDIKLKSDEKSIVNRAKVIMKKQNKDYFTVTSLLSIRKDFDAKEAETILNLIKKKVFQPKL